MLFHFQMPSQKESLKPGETNKEQEVSDTVSLGDTGSSILYLLESNSGSQNNSSNSDADQSEVCLFVLYSVISIDRITIIGNVHTHL